MSRVQQRSYQAIRQLISEASKSQSFDYKGCSQSLSQAGICLVSYSR
jgi:hypothetical protein